MPAAAIVQIFNIIAGPLFQYLAEAKARGEAVKTFNSEQMIALLKANSQEVVDLTAKYKAEWEAEA